jgi:SAM-dependent methyltransferase
MGEIFPRPRPPVPMPFTGERLTSEGSGQSEIEHLHRYLLARQLCAGKDVVDVASGEGYGSALLAQVAVSVTGIEIAADAVTHAAASFRRPNLRFVRGDARAMGLADASADVVVSFETIEHLAEQEAFLAEIRRVLRPDGILIVSTPDQDNYSPADSPANPFHVIELAKEEFARLLGRHFQHVGVLRQRPVVGSILLPAIPDGAEALVATFERRGDYLESSAGLPRPQYVVAVASAQPLQSLPPSIYIDTGRIDSLDEAERAARIAVDDARRVLEEERAALAALTADKAAADASMFDLRQALDAERAASAVRLEQLRQALDAERAAAAARVDDLQRALDTERAAAAAMNLARERAEEASLVTRRELAECQARAAQQATRISELLSSNSWRITAPLRAVFGPLRRR